MLQAEAAHFAKLKGGPGPVVETPEFATNTAKRQLENGDGEEEDQEAKRRRVLEETRDIDADSDEAADDDSSDDDRLVLYLVRLEIGANEVVATMMRMKLPSFSVSWRKSSASELRSEKKRLVKAPRQQLSARQS